MRVRVISSRASSARRAIVAAAVSPVIAGSAVAVHESGFRLVPALLIAAASLVAAGIYVARLRPETGLGMPEVVAFVIFAVVATCASAYVQEGTVTPLTFAVSLAMACLAAAIVDLTRHVPGVRPLSAVRWLLIGLVVAAFEVPLLVVALRLGPLSAALPLIALPLGLVIISRARWGGPGRLMGAVDLLAMLQVAYALLWSAGMMLQA